MKTFLARFVTVEFVAALVGTGALVVMIGWIFKTESLTRLFLPGQQNMKFVTAFLFLVSALGLYLISRAMRGNEDLPQVILPGVMLTVFVITISLYAGRLLNAPTGIEQLFVRMENPVDLSAALSTYGWPSLLSVFNFILFGFAGAISLFPDARSRRWLRYIGSLISAVGAVAVAGYVFRLPVLYYATLGSPPIPMALVSALAFVLLGLGLVMAGREPDAR